VHPLNAGGTLAPDASPTCVVKLTQGSHSIAANAGNTTVYVPEVAAINHRQGSRIHSLRFDVATGQLTPTSVTIPPPDPPDLSLGPAVELGTRFTEALWADGKLTGPRNRFNSRCEPGPRQFCIHPHATTCHYFANEQGNSVTQYNASQDTLHAMSTAASVPADYPGADVDLSAPHCAGGCSHLSEIHVHPNGATLYASNRGYDSVACFALDPRTGDLQGDVFTKEALCDHTPQCFALDPLGVFLYAGGGPSRTGGPHPGLDFVPDSSDGGKLSIFRVDGHGLEKVGQLVLQAAPSWVVAVNLDGARL
jgi:hypothetical protein